MVTEADTQLLRAVPNLPAEEWRAIPDWEDRYQVSNLGRVKRISFNAPDRSGKIKPYPELLKKKVPHKRGYVTVNLSRDGKNRHVLVHRLVATAFHGQPGPDQVANHKDGDKTNNRASNLEWVTQAENMRHAVETGLQRSARGEAAGNSKLNRHQVRHIRAHLAAGERVKTIAQRFGVSQRAIRSISTGRTWGHIE